MHTRFTRVFVALFAIVSLLATTILTGTQARADEPAAGNAIVFPGNDGQAHDVSWDGHSFTIDGERLVIWSGELHHWRVPHEDGWRDVLQKLRASGFSAVWLYCRVKAGSVNFLHSSLSVHGAPHGENAPPCASVMNIGEVVVIVRKPDSWSPSSRRPASQEKPIG